MTAEVVGVISDLHANARALRAALADVDRAGVDHLVILGDLLTYGVDVDEVLDLVEDRVARGADLVLGNHDQLYLDLARGERGYYDSLGPWLQETVSHTADRLDADRFRALPWREARVRGRWAFHHANPFPYGDWRYLTQEGEGRAAARALRDRGHRGGVFGHTHRRKVWAFAEDGGARPGADTFEAGDGPDVWVVNAGSVGQPRHADRAITWLRLRHDADGAAGELRAVAWDVEGHRAALAASGMTDPTIQRLSGFFG